MSRIQKNPGVRKIFCPQFWPEMAAPIWSGKMRSFCRKKKTHIHKIPPFIRGFEKGLADRRGWCEEILPMPDDAGRRPDLFSSQFFLCTLRRRGTQFWELFCAVFWALLGANPLPPTPFAKPLILGGGGGVSGGEEGGVPILFLWARRFFWRIAQPSIRLGPFLVSEGPLSQTNQSSSQRNLAILRVPLWRGGSTFKKSLRRPFSSPCAPAEVRQCIFFDFSEGDFARNFGGKFSDFFQTHKTKAQNLRGKFRTIFWGNFVARKRFESFGPIIMVYALLPCFPRKTVYTVALFALWPQGRVANREKRGATVVVHTLFFLALGKWKERRSSGKNGETLKYLSDPTEITPPIARQV